MSLDAATTLASKQIDSSANAQNQDDAILQSVLSQNASLASNTQSSGADRTSSTLNLALIAGAVVLAIFLFKKS